MLLLLGEIFPPAAANIIPAIPPLPLELPVLVERELAGEVDLFLPLSIAAEDTPAEPEDPEGDSSELPALAAELPRTPVPLDVGKLGIASWWVGEAVQDLLV